MSAFFFPKSKYIKAISSGSSFFYNHIKGLGIGNLTNFRINSQGLIAQKEVKIPINAILSTLNKQTFEFNGILLSGPSGSGKTSLGIAFSLSIDPQIPFKKINGFDIYSPIVSKFEILTQAIRTSLGITFYQESLIIEGEVVRIQIHRKKNSKNKIYGGNIIIKSKKVQNTYEIGPNILKKILSKKIKKGETIGIDKASGRLFRRKKPINIKSPEILSTNERTDEECLEKHRITEHFITFHELDLLNTSKKTVSMIFSNFKSEIGQQTRNKIDTIAMKWAKTEKIKIIKGLLFIEDVHLFDIDTFSFLRRIMEGFLTPIFFFVTNYAKTKIRGTSLYSNHGLPVAFINRLLLISSHPNFFGQIEEILNLHSNEEMIILERNTLLFLAKIGIECGIFYPINLLAAFSLSSPKYFRKIKPRDVKKSYNLFSDYKRYIRYSNIPKFFIFKTI